MQGVPHHLLSVYDPKDPINVTDYIQTATQVFRCSPCITLFYLCLCFSLLYCDLHQVIHSVQEKGLIPIVVGGTNTIFY